MRSPVSSMRMATARGTARSRFETPPTAGMLAQRASGSPKVAVGAAMRRSQSSASSSPPPSACPLIAAISGLPMSSVDSVMART